MKIIAHITTRAEWEKGRREGEYRAPSLGAEGFVHCSTLVQVVETANRFFSGASDLVLLLIDEDRALATVKYEPAADGPHLASMGQFPHLFGPLNLDAVIDVIDFSAGADGTFTLPTSIGER